MTRQSSEAQATDQAGASRIGPSGQDDEEARLWAVFAETGSSAETFAAWLALQCRIIPSVRTGLLLVETDGAFRPAAIWPTAMADVTYLGDVAERAIRERRGVVHVGGAGVMVAYPVETGETLDAVVVVDVAARPGAETKAALRQLHWGAGWLGVTFGQARLADLSRRVERGALALDVLAAAEDHGTLQASAMAIVNAMAAHLDCDRIWLGLRRGRRMTVAAVSHSANFAKKSDLAAAVQAAMGEALDQSATVVQPAESAGASERRVIVAHAELARQTRIGANATVLLRQGGRPIGALTLERQTPIDPDTLAMAEAIAATAGPLIGLRRKAERPVAGWIADGIGRGAKRVVGRDHPGLKAVALLALTLVAILALTRGEFRVTARAVLEGSIQRAAVAPVQGFIAEAPARAGDRVSAGQILARLDDADLRLERIKYQGELQKLAQRSRDALAKHDRATLGVIAAQTAAAEAELALAEAKLARMRVLAPIDGLVVSGDLSQMLGSPVEQGKVLFEVAPLDSYRLILQVDEGDARYVEVGQAGAFAPTGHAEDRVRFTIDKLTPVSTPQDGRNVFRIEGRLADGSVALVRPGMEGIGKVTIGAEPLLWIWTRSTVARSRTFVWAWTP